MNFEKPNLILLSDAYKYSHHKLYFPNTTKIYSYLESRGGLFRNTVFYGLQYILKKYLEGNVITQECINEAETLTNGVFNSTEVFSRSNFEYILHKHDGRLPVRIRAVPEGTVVPVGNVLMTIENTDPRCYWLSTFLETLLMQIWYPITVATLSFEIRKVIKHYYEATSNDDSFSGVDFTLNDFGFRGASSIESAAIGGSAHLLSFSGSDTVIASKFIQQYYNTNKIYGLSVPASEHSVMSMLGKEGESEMFAHVLQAFPTGPFACVSDTYDLFHAASELWGKAFKQKILNREGVLIVRPDSGDVVQTLLQLFEILFDRFGFSINNKGYKVLPPQIRVIQGDGINYNSICRIYQALKNKNISAENLVFGMGGALLQKVDRDTQLFAIKCSHAEINNVGRDVCKSPIELNQFGNKVSSFKSSKTGRLKLIRENGVYSTVAESAFPNMPDQLNTIFENGKIIQHHDFETIRTRLKEYGKQQYQGSIMEEIIV